MAQAVSNSTFDSMPSADALTPAGGTVAASEVVTRAYAAAVTRSSARRENGTPLLRYLLPRPALLERPRAPLQR